MEVYVTFSDEQTGLKAKRSCYTGRKNSWLPLEKCEAEISINKGLVFPSFKCTQFPLKLAWASTVLKFQGFSLEQGVIDFDL